MSSTGYDSRKNMGPQDPAVFSFKLSDLEEVIPSPWTLICFHVITKIKWDLKNYKYAVVLSLSAPFSLTKHY